MNGVKSTVSIDQVEKLKDFISKLQKLLELYGENAEVWHEYDGDCLTISNGEE